MTIAELAAQLAPIAHAALAEDDPDVQRAAIVLAALMGCIDDGGDRAALDPLAIAAGLICEHMTGRHNG